MKAHIFKNGIGIAPGFLLIYFIAVALAPSVAKGLGWASPTDTLHNLWGYGWPMFLPIILVASAKETRFVDWTAWLSIGFGSFLAQNLGNIFHDQIYKRPIVQYSPGFVIANLGIWLLAYFFWIGIWKITAKLENSNNADTDDRPTN